MGLPKFGKGGGDLLERVESAMKLYEEGWAIELKKYSKSPTLYPFCDSANSKFTKCLQSLQSISKEAPSSSDNLEINKQIEIIQLKLKGNDKLKMALNCQRQAQSFFREGNARQAVIRWKDSLEDFRTVKKCFEHGEILAGGDRRFEEALNFVDKQLQILVQERQAMYKMEEETHGNAGVERELEKQVHKEILKQLDEERQRDGLLRENVMQIHKILTPVQVFSPLMYTLRLMDNVKL